MGWLTFIAVLLLLVAYNILTTLERFAQAFAPRQAQSVADQIIHGSPPFRTIVDQMAAFMVDMDKRIERIEEMLIEFSDEPLEVKEMRRRRAHRAEE